MSDHPSANRVEFDIAHATQQIALLAHNACLAAASSEMPGTLESGVDFYA